MTPYTPSLRASADPIVVIAKLDYRTRSAIRTRSGSSIRHRVQSTLARVLSTARSGWEEAPAKHRATA